MWKKVNRALKQIQKENKVTILPSLSETTSYIVECSRENYSILN